MKLFGLPWEHPDAIHAREAAAMVFNAESKPREVECPVTFKEFLRAAPEMFAPIGYEEARLIYKFRRLACVAYANDEGWIGPGVHWLTGDPAVHVPSWWELTVAAFAAPRRTSDLFVQEYNCEYVEPSECDSDGRRAR